MLLKLVFYCLVFQKRLRKLVYVPNRKLPILFLFFLIGKTIHTSQIKFCFVCFGGWIKLEYPGKIPKKLGSNNYIKCKCLIVSSDIQALISGLKK